MASWPTAAPSRPVSPMRPWATNATVGVAGPGGTGGWRLFFGEKNVFLVEKSSFSKVQIEEEFKVQKMKCMVLV